MVNYLLYNTLVVNLMNLDVVNMNDDVLHQVVVVVVVVV